MPMFLRQKNLVGCFAVILALLVVLPMPSCSSSGTLRGGGTFKVFDQEFWFEFEIEWGKPSESLPPGSVYLGTMTYRNRTVEVYRDPDGRYWIRFPGSKKFNPIEDMNDDLKDQLDDMWESVNDNDDPDIVSKKYDNIEVIGELDGRNVVHYNMVQSGNSHDVVDLGDMEYEFDWINDTASLSFVLPADASHNFQDPSMGPFWMVNWNAVQNADGSITITYWGTINEVLGASMAQGIVEMEYEDSYGDVYTIEIDNSWTAAFVYVNGVPAHEFIGGGEFSAIALQPSQD